MYISIDCGLVIMDQPTFHEVEFHGRIDETTFFVVHHPLPSEEGGTDWKESELGVQIGSVDRPEGIQLKLGEKVEVALESVKVEKVVRYPRERTLDIETERGKFHLPDPWHRKEEVPTLDNQPIKLLP